MQKVVYNVFKRLGRDNMPDYLSASDTAARWGIKTRRVALLCEKGRIPGAYKIGSSWAIPANAEKPADARISNGKYIRTKKNKTDRTEENQNE